METINLISALTDVNLNPANVPPDTPNSNLAVQNIPILENNKIVFIERAFVLDATEEMIAAALANSTLEDSDSGSNLAGLLSTPSIPEPSTVMLAGAMAVLSVFKRRR
jgi:hypothetical protein